MSSSPAPDESPFSALPASTKRIIDNAFNLIANPSPPPPRKRQKTHHNASGSESVTAGGFIVDDVQPGGFIVDDTEPSDPAGGFIPSSSTPPPTPQSHIPFPLIPRALQLLSLPPDDPEILSVFQNAASGWKSKTEDSNSPSESLSFGEGETVVSRDDWRAVCAVLLEDSPGKGNEDAGTNREEEEEEESEGGSDAEEYQEDEDEENEPSSDDTYTAGASTKSKKSKPTRKSRRVQSPTSSDSSKRLNRQQTQACRVAFSLFFPSIPDSSLDQQRITIRDIDRVAKLLKEKIKAEEVRLAF
jgi:hypothetical protein